MSLPDIVWNRDGYPTGEAIQYISTMSDPTDVLNAVCMAWQKIFGVSDQLRLGERETVGAKQGEHYLRLATGGWSGNESLISALKENRIVWTRTWELSARGGLFIFRYP